jgi:hypothetical protein
MWTSHHPWRLATALLAVVAPVLLAFHAPPSSTFLNQAVALFGWGVFLAVTVGTGLPGRAGGRGTAVLQSAFGGCAAAVVIAMVFHALPTGLGLSNLGALAAAAVTVAVASQVDVSTARGSAFRAVCAALVVAALASTAIAIVQYFFPSLPDGDVIARVSTPGRVGANLRQPNHLASLLLAALAAAVWLREAGLARRDGTDGGRRRAGFVAVVLTMVFGVVLTVSRTGALCVLILAAWGMLDRRLSRFTRATLCLLPLALAAFWWGVDAWASAMSQAFAGDAQLHKGDLSSSRFGIWSNTLELIRANPWTGTGWGDFNFAWTLTPFPGRPVAFFDHTHNLPLHVAVEMGLPLAALVMALLFTAYGLAVRKALVAVPDDLPAVRCSLVMVTMMGVHSLLEYPLWYAYFLLPTAFAFGVALSGREAKEADAEAPAPSRTRPVLLAGSALLALGAVASVVDYWKVVQIFSPGDDAPPLEARIELGRTSVLFRHHAEYAAVTTASKPSTEMPGFAIASHYLLDARLMVAWSKAFAEVGDLDRARYVAQRLKEFRHPIGDAFFAPCTDPSTQPMPFQCEPPARTLTFRDFRGPR